MPKNHKHERLGSEEENLNIWERLLGTDDDHLLKGGIVIGFEYKPKGLNKAPKMPKTVDRSLPTSSHETKSLFLPCEVHCQ